MSTDGPIDAGPGTDATPVDGAVVAPPPDGNLRDQGRPNGIDGPDFRGGGCSCALGDGSRGSPVPALAAFWLALAACAWGTRRKY